MCHKPAQIDNTERPSTDAISITTFDGADLFKNFQDTYNCKHNFYEVIDDLSAYYYSYQHEMAEELRYGIISHKK